MSTLHVAVGQGGNVIAQHLLQSVFGALRAAPEPGLEGDGGGGGGGALLDPLFRQSEQRRLNSDSDGHDAGEYDRGERTVLAHGLALDGEDKVVGRLAATSRDEQSPVCLARRVHRSTGCANNFAAGLNLLLPAVLDEALDALRLEAEAVDRVAAFHLIHSVGGGTGSGAGAGLLTALADSFPEALRLCASVVPRQLGAGEVSVQALNGSLALACARECAHAVVLLENDRYANLVTDWTRGSGLSERALLGTVNQVMVSDLAALLTPTASWLGGDLPRAAALAAESRRPRFGAWECEGGGRRVGDSRRPLWRVHSCALAPLTAFFAATAPRHFLLISHAPHVRPNARKFQHDRFDSLQSAVSAAADGGCAVSCPRNDVAVSRAVLAWGAGSAAWTEQHGVGTDSGATSGASSGDTRVASWRFASPRSFPQLAEHTAMHDVSAHNTRESVSVMATRALRLVQGGLYVHHYESLGVEREDIADACARLLG